MKKVISVLCSLALLLGLVSFFPIAIDVQAVSNEQMIYEYLVNDLGLNTAAACGVLANIEKESGFRPDLMEKGYTWEQGAGYGICQWTNYPRDSGKGRRTNLINWCSFNGYDYKTLTGQLNFLKHELETDVKKGVYAYLKGVSNDANGAYNAGYKWCYSFEVPAGYNTGVSETRGNYARNTYWPKYGPVVPWQEDNSYVVPVTLKAKQKGDTYDRNGNKETNRWIDEGDDCYIEKVYTNGLCHVEYPSGNTRRWAYAEVALFDFYKKDFPGEEDTSYEVPDNYTAKRKDCTYDDDGTIESGHWIDAGDNCYVEKVYKSGYCRVQYPAGSTLRWAFAKTDLFDIPIKKQFPGSEDTSYAVPVWRNAKYHDNTYNENGNMESDRWIDEGDNCYIDKVYQNGFCHVQYPAGSVQRWAYAKASLFDLPKKHIYITGVFAPTCTKQGYTIYTCSDCGDSYKDSYVDALGHDYEEIVIAPNETEQGYTLHTCKRCGDSYTDHFTEPVPVYLAGDINGDGKVNMKDVTRLHQHINGWDISVVEAAIDVNGDGKVNMKDVTRLHQYVNGWDVAVYVSGHSAAEKITAKKAVYGKSESGRDLVYYDFVPENYTSTVLLNFAIHGYEDEYNADAQVLVDTAESLIEHYNTIYPEGCKTRLIIIPCANPDGLYDGTTNNGFGRCNANGVDLNRDFDANYKSYSSARNYTPYAFSAAESRALRDLYSNVQPKAVIDFHGWENCTIGNYELAQIFAEEMGLSHYVNFMTTNASGYFSNWAYQQGSYSLLVEFTNSHSINFGQLVASVDRLIKEDYLVSGKDSDFQKFDTITCYTLSTERETTYQYFDKPYSTSSYIDGATDQCILLGIHENGWAKVQYPITNGYKAAYCTLDKFISPSERVTMYQYTVKNNTNVYKRKDMAEKFGTVYPTDEMYVVAQTDNALQVIYTLDNGGWKMGWIVK